jgi:hypothetical protein
MTVVSLNEDQILSNKLKRSGLYTDDMIDLIVNYKEHLPLRKWIEEHPDLLDPSTAQSIRPVAAVTMTKVSTIKSVRDGRPVINNWFHKKLGVDVLSSMGLLYSCPFEVLLITPDAPTTQNILADFIKNKSNEITEDSIRDAFIKRGIKTTIRGVTPDFILRKETVGCLHNFYSPKLFKYLTDFVAHTFGLTREEYLNKPLYVISIQKLDTLEFVTYQRLVNSLKNGFKLV